MTSVQITVLFLMALLSLHSLGANQSPHTSREDCLLSFEAYHGYLCNLMDAAQTFNVWPIRYGEFHVPSSDSWKGGYYFALLSLSGRRNNQSTEQPTGLFTIPVNSNHRAIRLTTNNQSDYDNKPLYITPPGESPPAKPYAQAFLETETSTLQCLEYGVIIAYQLTCHYFPDSKKIYFVQSNSHNKPSLRELVLNTVTIRMVSGYLSQAGALFKSAH